MPPPLSTDLFLALAADSIRSSRCTGVMATKRSVGTLVEADLKGKVFVRSDLNVPLDDAQNITVDTCIRASIPTIKFMLVKGAKVVLASHLVATLLCNLAGSDVYRTIFSMFVAGRHTIYFQGVCGTIIAWKIGSGKEDVNFRGMVPKFGSWDDHSQSEMSNYRSLVIDATWPPSSVDDKDELTKGHSGTCTPRPTDPDYAQGYKIDFHL